MSAEIATLDKVKAAVAQLHQDGRRATADAVFAIIGGGSKPTILKHLKTLREEPKPVDDDVPAAILDLPGRFWPKSLPRAARRKQAATATKRNACTACSAISRPKWRRSPPRM